MICRNQQLKCWSVFAGLFLAWSPASAKVCGQQTVLNAAQRLGPHVKTSVSRDQARLQAFENQAVRSLVQFGFSISDLQRLLVDYEASVPVYCLVTPDFRPRGKINSGPLSPYKKKAQLNAIIAEWRRSFGVKPEDSAETGCSDCKISNRWKEQYLVSQDLFNKSGRLSPFEAAYMRTHFAKVHHSISNGVISIFIDRINQYAM